MSLILNEKYRPKSLEDLVIINEAFKKKLESWKEKGYIDNHLILYGPAGTGKTSTINVILKELDINDYIIINGSDKTGIDDIRKIINYASVSPINEKPKIIIIEEFERNSPQAQDSLKYVLETYSKWCRFIFTTNNINKITSPIISRCETFNFNKIDEKQFVQRIIKILNNEKIQYNLDDVVEYIRNTYPDLRKCINEIDKNIIDNKLLKYEKGEYQNNLDQINLIINYINKKADCLEVQKSISLLKENDIEQIYKYFYNNIEKITNDREKWDLIFICIAEYLIKNNNVAFKDLNLMACICDIKLICNPL